MNTDNMRERAVAVSVVVPVYNVEKYIERCIDSLVRQEFGYKYEIIIVNDGTKDNSMTIAKRRPFSRKKHRSCKRKRRIYRLC